MLKCYPMYKIRRKVDGKYLVGPDVGRFDNEGRVWENTSIVKSNITRMKNNAVYYGAGFRTSDTSWLKQALINFINNELEVVIFEESKTFSINDFILKHKKKK